MDLEFSDEQLALREMVRGVCGEYSPIEVVRAMEDDPKGYPDELWKQLGELGLHGIVVSEEYGGAALGMLEAVLLYEEFGRSLAPTPHFVSSILSARLVELAGSDSQKREWLPAIAAGEAIFSPAWTESDGGFGPKGVQLEAAPDGDGFVLTGVKRHVGFASSADRLVVLARTGASATDMDLFLVDPTSEGITLTQQTSLGSDTQYEVAFAEVHVPARARLGAAGSGWGTFDAAMHDGIIVLAAQAMGGAERALEMTVQYAKDRHQFGKPLGAFQALSHYLADALTSIDGGKVLVYEAAWARDEGKDISELAPMAKLFACDTYVNSTKKFQQIWGGVGFTVEYDIQLFFRRAKQLQITWWDASYLEELVAAAVLDD